jgi:MFS family permease
MSGTLIGPAIGYTTRRFYYFLYTLTTFSCSPFIAGVIVTYRSWRVIFYLQAALGGLATVLVFFFLPETIHQKRSHELAGLSFGQKAGRLWQMTNPLRVIKLYRYPNLVRRYSPFHTFGSTPFRSWR